MACGSPADELLASLSGAGAIVEPPLSYTKLTPHGRRSFTGDRRVLVAMGNSYLDALGRTAARLEADHGA